MISVYKHLKGTLNYEVNSLNSLKMLCHLQTLLQCLKSFALVYRFFDFFNYSYLLGLFVKS